VQSRTVLHVALLAGGTLAAQTPDNVQVTPTIVYAAGTRTNPQRSTVVQALFQGKADADKTVPIAQSEEMLEQCNKIGVHAFWNQPKYAPETTGQAAAFFHEVLGN